MWDAHIVVWTDGSIKAGKRKQIKSFEELEQMVKAGFVINARMNANSPNSFVAKLKPSKAIINCPVITQPTNHQKR